MSYNPPPYLRSTRRPRSNIRQNHAPPHIQTYNSSFRPTQRTNTYSLDLPASHLQSTSTSYYATINLRFHSTAGIIPQPRTYDLHITNTKPLPPLQHHILTTFDPLLGQPTAVILYPLSPVTEGNRGTEPWLAGGRVASLFVLVRR